MRDTPLILPYATSDLVCVRPALIYALMPRLGSRRCQCTRRSRRLKRWEQRRDAAAPEAIGGVNQRPRGTPFGRSRSCRNDDPIDMPFGIHDAGRDVIAAAQNSRRSTQARTLRPRRGSSHRRQDFSREPPVPVEIGALRFDEMLGDGLASVAAELLRQAVEKLREAVEFGMRMDVKRGHRSLQGCPGIGRRSGGQGRRRRCAAGAGKPKCASILGGRASLTGASSWLVG